MPDLQSSFLPLNTEGIELPMLQIFEAQTGLILILSPDFSILGVTSAFLQELGLKKKEIVGRNVFEVFPQNPQSPELSSVKNLQNSLAQVLVSGEQHQVEKTRYDIPDKEEPGKFLERYWSVTNTPVKDAKGKVQFIIHETRNISDKIKSLKHIRDSEKREQEAVGRVKHQRIILERYFSQIPAQICIFRGPDFVFEFVNPSFQEELFPGRKILGRPLAEAVPEVMDQPIADVLRKVYETGETIEGKEVYIPLAPFDGAPLKDHYFNYIQQARFDEKGNVDGIMTFAYDVSELVEARQKLQAINSQLEDRIFARTKELQLARSEAERQKESLRALLMQAPVAICIFQGPSMIYEMVNPAYQELFPGRRLKGRPLFKAIPEFSGSEVWEQLQKVLRTGEAYEAKEALIPAARREEGPIESIYFNYTLQPQYNEQQEIEGVLVFAYDVTEQVAARHKVEKSEEILQFALDAGRMATFDLDLLTNQTIRSANHDQLFGYEANIPEWNMEALLAHMLPEDHEPVLQQFAKSLETGELWLTPRIRRQNGQLRYIEGQGKVFYTEDSSGTRKPVRIAGVVTDITERKLNQQRGERLASIVENSSDFIGVSTLDGIGLYINQAGKEMVGLEDIQSVEELRVSDFFSVKDQQMLQDEVLPAVFEKGSWQGELHFRNFKSGEWIPVYYTAFSIKDPSSGELLGLATITSDITEIKRKEVQLHKLSQDLAQANQELRAANAAIQASNHELEGANQQLTHINVDLDNFIYAASHDLKAPISNIEGLLQLLQMKLPKDTLKEESIENIVRMMEESIHRFQKTIANLTDITKLQKDNNTENVTVEVGQVVKEVILDLQPMIQKAEASLKVEMEGCPAVSFAEKNMRSIVYNLISNAIKYRSPSRKPQVTIRYKTEPDHLVLQVQDNGLGLSAANEKKLFSMFSRFHSHVEGTGIGLYMVKKIIDNAGGKIEVSSKEGEGTTFSVYFRHSK